jgi:adenylate cyclase
LHLGGTRAHVTVLFGDIRGYTRLSQEIPPEEVVELLNEHFTEMSRVVFQHEGTLDKFIGDCVMAVFGWPFSTGNDELNALRAARAMQASVATRNARPGITRALHMGIGINTGDVIAGNVGGPQKMDFTVIGDAVNVAARLQALAQPGQIVVGPATYAAVQAHFACEHIGELELKNVLQPLACYRVLGEA